MVGERSGTYIEGTVTCHYEGSLVHKITLLNKSLENHNLLLYGVTTSGHSRQHAQESMAYVTYCTELSVFP